MYQLRLLTVSLTAGSYLAWSDGSHLLDSCWVVAVFSADRVLRDAQALPILATTIQSGRADVIMWVQKVDSAFIQERTFLAAWKEVIERQLLKPSSLDLITVFSVSSMHLELPSRAGL